MIGTGRYPRSANIKASLIASAPGRSITTALSGLVLCSCQIGAGASTLATLIHIVLTGRHPAIMVVEKGDAEELRKHIDAIQIAFA